MTLAFSWASRTSSRASSRASSRVSHTSRSNRWGNDEPFLVGPEDVTLESTLHNISIDPETMDGPADGNIFESNHLGELVDVHSKLFWKLAKAAESYCHIHAWFLNLTSTELDAFISNWERDFNNHCQYIHHIDSLLSRDSRHRIQLGYHVISLPRYVPTTAKLCTTSFGEIIEKIKAELD